MNPKPSLSDRRVFPFTEESLRRGKAMTVAEKIQWLEEMLLLSWAAQAQREKGQQGEHTPAAERADRSART